MNHLRLADSMDRGNLNINLPRDGIDAIDKQGQDIEYIILVHEEGSEFPIQTTKDITMLALKVININFTRRGERDFFWRRFFFFQRKYICYLVSGLQKQNSWKKNLIEGKKP